MDADVRADGQSRKDYPQITQMTQISGGEPRINTDSWADGVLTGRYPQITQMTQMPATDRPEFRVQKPEFRT